MPMRRAASAMDPVSFRYWSSSALPGPSAMSSPQVMRRRGRRVGADCLDEFLGIGATNVGSIPRSFEELNSPEGCCRSRLLGQGQIQHLDRDGEETGDGGAVHEHGRGLLVAEVRLLIGWTVGRGGKGYHGPRILDSGAEADFVLDSEESGEAKLKPGRGSASHGREGDGVTQERNLYGERVHAVV